LTDAQAKAKKVKVVKVPKTGKINEALVDFTPKTEEETKTDSKPKPTPSKPTVTKAPATARDTKGAKESATGPEIDKDADFATDPIAACTNERLKAGNVQESIKEADAKKKKIPIPAALGLKIADAKQLTLEFVKEESIEPEKVLKKAISERMT